MATIEQDYYELLGVARAADGDAIKSAYRKLAVQCHPDKNNGCKDSEAKFKALSEAYDCLKDPQKRAAYDRFGKAGLNGHANGQPGMHGFEDIFEGIFGDFMGRQGRGGRTVHRGQDLRYDLELSLEDAFHGKPVTIELPVTVACEACEGSGATAGTKANSCGTCAGQGKVRTSQGFFFIERTCPTCQGAGQTIADPCKGCRGQGRVERTRRLEVSIPAGVDDGTRIRLAGEGETGIRGGPSGDLYIFVHMKSHRLWKRDGTTLFAQVPLSMTTAALGGEIDAPAIDREPCPLKIPAGAQSGKQFRVRGRGMPALGGAGRGDLVIQVDVETPVKLNKRQRELLEEFQAIEHEHGATCCPKSSGFWGKLKGVWDEITP